VKPVKLARRIDETAREGRQQTHRADLRFRRQENVEARAAP
jgi:hypothetical protein